MPLVDNKNIQPVKPLSLMVQMKDGQFDDFIAVKGVSLFDTTESV